MIPESTVWKIRDLWSQGCTQTAIAAQFQVSRSTVGRVTRGTWEPHRFGPGQVLRLLELWEIAMSLRCRSLVGRCRACREPVDLPCTPCLARILESFAVRTPVKWLEGECVCGGNFPA
jgi:hypothetical protein